MRLRNLLVDFLQDSIFQLNFLKIVLNLRALIHLRAMTRALYRGVVWSKLSQSGASSFLLHSIEGLNGAHFFVIGSVYLIKNAFLAFLNSLPERFARLKIAILCPHSLHLSFKKTAYSFKSMFIYKKSPESLTKLNCKNWIIPKLKVVLFWIHSLHMAFNNKSNLLESIFITKKSLKISLNLNS